MPFTGEIIDAKNALLSTYKGRYGDAALHAAGFMIPFIPGKILTKGKKAVTNWMNTNAPSVYKLNPWAFKPKSNAGYRMIGDEKGYFDAIKSGEIRPTNMYDNAHFNIGMPLNPNRLSPEKLIELGSPLGYKGPYMAEMTHGNWKRMTDGATGDMLETLKSMNKHNDVWQHPKLGNIKINDPRLTLYKEDWLRGYTPVSKLPNKQYGGSLPKAQDGIDLGEYSTQSFSIPEEVDFNQLEKGIRYAESLNGELMKNPNSSASGLYQQLFDEIKYDGTRKEFIEDIDYQKELFRQRAYGEMKDVPGLLNNGTEVYNEYKDQINLSKHGLTPLTIAGLSNMLGRQGTRKYIGNVLRDGSTIEEIFPHLYGEDAEFPNHTPTEYIEKFNKGLLIKKQGGQVGKKIKRLKQQLQLYKNGKEMSPLAEREINCIRDDKT